MLTDLHILLTYNCSLRCRHCYIFSDQRASGKISLSQISQFLNDGRKHPDLKWVFFTGGEPFTQYPLLLKAVQRARKLDYEVGIETNGFFARTESAALRFLRPLADMRVKEIRISNDILHYKNPDNSPAKRALLAAQKLGMSTKLVRIPYSEADNPKQNEKYPVTSILEPQLMFSGRAADTMLTERPSFDWKNFTRCPRSDIAAPRQVFVDAYGFVQICPGISIGNASDKPLHRIIEDYDLREHPILLPLHAQGPSGLIRDFNIHTGKEYVGPCHCCYLTRRELIDQYPELLGPRNVYGF
jgi:MoaA/NifB/PqqE/SkfB family radical SAM enzyme